MSKRGLVNNLKNDGTMIDPLKILDNPPKYIKKKGLQKSRLQRKN